MLRVWLVVALLYVVLPFQLIERTLSLYGFLVFALFLGAFYLGARALPQGRPAQDGWLHLPNVARANRILRAAGVLAMLCFLVDLQQKSVLDLGGAYDLRSDVASALLAGDVPSSSLAFQIGFLSYPAGYVYLASQIVFEKNPRLLDLLLFGGLPVLLATLAMGGRSPLLYALLIAVAAVSARKLLHPRPARARSSLLRLPFILIAAGAMYFFIAVFFARAAAFGGAAGMFDVAESIWGIGFSGPMAQVLLALAGEEATFVVFIFNWYIVQGLLMSNFLFTGYDGPLQFGVYGIDLAAALLRRIDGALVAQYFDSLLQLGTYGFLPSAFGSLYVDFWFFGILISLLWGVLAGLVYRRIRTRRDARWLLLGPFVTIGIVFSCINTPLGFCNGFVTHFWMLVAFFVATPVVMGAPSAATGVASDRT